MKTWEDLVLETAERFGGSLPHPATAEAIRPVYERAPLAVLRAIERVCVDFDAGTVRSPWGVLKARVGQISDDQPRQQRSNERERAITRAEQWIRATGIHFDRQTEVEQELFGSSPTDLDVTGEPLTSAGTAILSAWSNDADLRARMLGLWREVRPLGVQVEREQIERLDRHRRMST